MRLSSIFARGLAMGAADIVPGVSGGTVAFITGIYPTWLNSLRSFDLQAVQMVLRGDFMACWQHVNGRFLSALLLGIATSLFSLARILSWVLQHYPEPLWAFFFGLILSSALLLLRQVGHWRAPQLAALLLGCAIALCVALAPRTGFLEGGIGIFLAGFIAICAMILPGISGSFILVVLGMYSSVLAALKGFELGFLFIFAAGAACGLLSFSRFLHWLLQRYYTTTLALLTGFLFGSLAVVWPWKRVLAWVAASDGQLKPAQQMPVFPDQYLLWTGDDPRLLLCVMLAVAACALVWWIDRNWGQAAAIQPH